MRKLLFLLLFLGMCLGRALGAENVGYESVGGSVYTLGATYAWAFKCLDTPSSDGVAANITVSVLPNEAVRYAKAALYTDSSGMPGSLVAGSDSAEVASTSGSVAEDIVFPCSGSPAITAGTTYWIVIHGKTGTDFNIYYDDVGTGRDASYKAMAYPGTWSSWGGVEDGSVTWRLGKGYFTYTEGGGATPTSQIIIIN